MKESYKIVLLSIAEYLVLGVIFLFIAAGLHEWYHLNFLKLLGGEGFIRLGPAETVIVTPSMNDGFVYMIGGIGTGCTLALISFLARGRFAELHASLIPIIFDQLSYGVFETFFWQLPFETYMTIAVRLKVFTMALGFAISVHVLRKALQERLRNTQKAENDRLLGPYKPPEH